MKANVPYIYPLSEARQKLGNLVRDMAAGVHGPVIIGPNANPRAVIVAWDLFDHLRDLLSELEVIQVVPQLRDRLNHPSGPAEAPLNAVSSTARPDLPARFWPDVVADLRNAASSALDQTLEAVITGDLGGQRLVDERLPGAWAWFLVTADSNSPGQVSGHYVIWRDVDGRPEFVGVLPAGDPVARMWQPAPDPEAPPENRM